MALNVFHDSGQGAYFVLLIVCGAICTVTIALRFTSTHLSGRKHGLEDWLALAAAAIFLVRVGVGMSALTIINGRGLNSSALDREAYEKVAKRILTTDLSTMLDQSLAKWSICALYHRVFGMNRQYALWIYIHVAVQVIAYTALVILQLLQCRPLNKFWQWWIPGECFPFSTVVVAIEPPNSILDFTLVLLALFMIRDLEIRTDAKWMLRLLCGVGSIAGIIGFLKVGLSYSADQGYIFAVVGSWAVIQSLACIVCCCAPVYRSLLPETGLCKSLKSKINSFSLRDARGPKTATRTRTEQPSVVEMGSQPLPGPGWLRLDAPSTRWLVTSDPEGRPETGDSTYPIDSIQVHRSVDVASGKGSTMDFMLEQGEKA